MVSGAPLPPETVVEEYSPASCSLRLASFAAATEDDEFTVCPDSEDDEVPDTFAEEDESTSPAIFTCSFQRSQNPLSERSIRYISRLCGSRILSPSRSGSSESERVRAKLSRSTESDGIEMTLLSTR